MSDACNGKGEMRVSPCATRGEAASRFGRDDGFFEWGVLGKASASAEADPYGMTNNRTGNGKDNCNRQRQVQPQVLRLRHSR
jgi:hypothetical protein